MIRRSFFGSLAGLLGYASTAGAAGIERRENARAELLRVPLAGYQFYDGDRVVTSLEKGMRLTLRREPDNPCDRNAVEIMTPDGVKLGYLPRSSVESIARNLDRGIPVQAEISEVDPHAESWRRIYVECFVEI